MTGMGLRVVNAALVAGLIGLVAAALLLSQSLIGRAHHENDSHIASLLSKTWHEQYCVEDSGTTLSFSTALNRVRNTLIVENTSANWDLKQGGYTDFRTTWGIPCRNLNSGTTPTRSEVELEYHVEDVINGNDETPSPQACGATSCAWPRGASWSGPHGRVEWQWYIIKLRGQLIKADDIGQPDTRRHVVNHETGHALGLADGGPTSGTSNTSCPGSVMHPGYYGCTSSHLIWPGLSTDHPAVNDIIFGNP